MRRLLALARDALLGLLAALLPAPERDRWAGRHGLRAPIWSVVLGGAQFFTGAVWFVLGGIGFVRAAAVGPTDAALAAPPPDLTTWHLQGLSAILWIAWFVNPASWPAAYLWLMGVARFAAYGIAHDAVGEPPVWVAVRGAQAIARWRRRREIEGTFGPRRPDRVRRETDGSWIVVTCRPKDDWDGAATIAIGGEWFRVASCRERTDGQWSALAYRLERHPPGEVVRKLVRYELPDMLH